ncbi:hypothetical protein NSPZN2_10152 [Nitrospira defluvii]|uniref:Uncharacterized protein n=1 Tax=Nitrospira defluvii TaxID=330214 RepID=A0ABM8QCN1_9BACT|nr:hypothetical protein NSPZN2_10152 [Nitrospira defluvii]
MRTLTESRHADGRLSLLAVVLLAGNMARRAILGMSDPSAFFLRDHAVALGLVLQVVDVVLSIVQASGLTFIQLAARNPLINTPLLVGLSLINPGRLCLREHH